MVMDYISKSLEETKKIACEVASQISGGAVLALYGELGSGKTTFTRYLVEALGVVARVQSPTFVVHRKYLGDGKTINHIDLYRLHTHEEVMAIGLVELVSEKDSVTIIEWPELVAEQLPQETIVINFDYLGEEGRKIHVQNSH